jgi:alanyl-tRNA synthetase
MQAMSQNVNHWGIPFKTGAEIRQSFIDFFVQRGHKFIPSSPVVPHDDPTLLFTNSGMNQFKAIFLGDNRLGLKRAVNSQKCIRASGKHNDLDDVGRDTYHQTFFEMLGNWSFGDYYKREALTWSWELLTEVWKLPKDRLFVTVYKNDDEAEEIWKKHTDIEPWRIMRFAEKSNFWEMGEVGPCGPCSEIHFDMGDLATQKATYADEIQGVNGTNARYIEIWNNVFMQNERLPSGTLKELPAKHVDTGMGFERICSIIQGTGSNYETDIFRPIIDKIAALTGVAYDRGDKGTPHRVVADHVRCLSFAIADGATPGNEGRGYVLRRILRRAARFSQQLDQKDPFIYKLVPTLVEVMGQAFPEISERRDYIAQVIEAEEQRFMRTLRDGLARFEKISAEVKAKKQDTIPGGDAFVLYDTYGFPMDLTGVLAEEAGLKMDFDGFTAAMEEQRERARGAAKFDAGLTSDEGWTILTPAKDTAFIGYETLEAPVEVTRFREVGDDILVCLKKSPFYAESGGQVGDSGRLEGPDLELKVVDTFKLLEMQVHKCALVRGLVKKESFKGLVASVDHERRLATMRNHSATHLLHAALRQVLGTHVQQQGSRVAPEGLRFDFTHPKALTAEELSRIETLVNEQVLLDSPVAINESALEEAKKLGAMALFGEKYGEKVRHIKMGDFSHELCGGTHARATGQIGLVRITSESSIASGIRRIEAVTGLGAITLARKEAGIVDALSRSLKVKPDELGAKVEDLSKKLKAFEKELDAIRLERLNGLVQQMIDSDAKAVGGSKCLVRKLDATAFPKSLHQSLLDTLAAKLGNGVAVLTQVEDGTLSILAAVGPEARAKVKAGDLVKELSQIAEGKGGGRPDRAQAGSRFPDKEPAVLAAAQKLAEKALGA